MQVTRAKGEGEGSYSAFLITEVIRTGGHYRNRCFNHGATEGRFADARLQSIRITISCGVLRIVPKLGGGAEGR